jgi:tetratricopeptide (TPR) repeat protein
VTVLVDGKLYLFDPALGMPIPAPGPIAVAHGGQLDLRPATLAEVRADDRLLRRLDAGPAQPYWVKQADLKHVVVLVEGSPQYLAKRMKLLESHLVGKQRMTLTATPAAQAQRLKEAAGADAAAQLWTLPYETLQRRWRLGPPGVVGQLVALMPLYARLYSSSPPLYRGRVLHLKGRFEGEQGAIACYQEARPSDQEFMEGFQAEAAKIGKMPKEQQLGNVVEAQLHAQACVRGKQAASYWLGLIAFEQGNYASAIDYFDKRTLQGVRDSQWGLGACYNLGRAYEASGQPQQAKAWYQRAEAILPASYGSLLRIGWLTAPPRKAEAPLKRP